MVRRPWLRKTRLLAGLPTVSASAPGGPLGEGDDVEDVDEEEDRAALGFDFLADFGPAVPLVAVAGSRRTLGDPMRRKW
jgi:hypothetical protein